jgi:hypothetical protein
MKAMRTSKDYDAMIEKYEQQLKDWKAKRRELRTVEARRAKAKAEEQRQRDLLQYGREVESYRDWMRMTVIFHDDGTRTNLLDWYEESKGEKGIRIIGDVPDDWYADDNPVWHQGADATQP